jgi:membrane protein DedA with SNARE-associated domain
MLIWCTILFLLGVLAFLDAVFNYGDTFRRVNSLMFMLISLGVLIRLRWERSHYKREESATSVSQKEKKETPVRIENLQS